MFELSLPWGFANLLLFLASIALTVVAGYLFSVVVRKSLGKINPLLSEIISRYGSWTIYVVGLLVSLELLNLRLETVLVFTALLGALVILGLKDVLPSIFARQFLEMYKPFRVGDWIRVGDTCGRVIDVNDLYTVVFTSSHEKLYIPNSRLLQERVYNLTAGTGFYVDVDFAASPSEGLDQLLRKVKGAIEEEAKEEGLEEPEIFVVGLEPDAVYLRVRVRVLNPQRKDEVRSRLLRRVYKAVRATRE
ncbi:mechanosensitive ion channel domain-containing protein [Thermofilum pendens]|uniref:MscS Mechanosensitive ion channel n=1 Tax=Thermofilum pendens (strain DSM 2475 / Hrk 5) TaxID=368408 RepID=A1RZG5_THEPD|nr:mechanosensitive ion channel family protein [Thermofilum pendens]ABL78595.1 MscS Mechanosensitive ion channel [Thermofilum pendens Hrk 5]